MSFEYYQSNPELRDYFNSLPTSVKMFLVETGVEICTLGELQQCAEHLINRDPSLQK